MSPESLDFRGKTIIVTGAASGIGRASARLFAQSGGNVVACDLSPAVEETADMIRQAGGIITAITMDASEEADVAAAVDTACSTYGGLDVFFANAGISGGPVPFFEATPELWAKILKVNLIGPYLALRHATPKMRERGGGSVIVTASVAGLRAGAGPVAYSASKAGVINLVQTAAQELANSQIRVNAICPGLIETGMTKAAYDYARQIGKSDMIGMLNPMKRGGEPEEIASVALFLASPLASYVNGQAIVVDGGLSTSHPTIPRPAGWVAPNMRTTTSNA